MSSLGIGLNGASLGQGGGAAAAAGPDANAIATAYFAAMSVQPDSTRKAAVTAAIAGLITDGVWATYDWISGLTPHDAQAFRVNAKNPAQIAFEVGTLDWRVNLGYRGDAVSTYLNSGVNDNAAGNWTRDACAYSIYIQADPTSGVVGSVFGLLGSAATRLAPQIAAAPVGRLHAATNVTGATGSSLGLLGMVRTDATTVRLDQNGVAGTPTTTATSVAPAAVPFIMGGGGGSFSNALFNVTTWGGIKTPTQSAAEYTRLFAHLTAIGAA